MINVIINNTILIKIANNVQRNILGLDRMKICSEFNGFGEIIFRLFTS